VLVIVCTVTGASPPTATLPTMIWRDWRRSILRHGRIADMSAHIVAAGHRANPDDNDRPRANNMIRRG